MKKIISIILALLCALTCMSMFGCGNKDREGVIDIEAFDGGYGVAYIEALAEEYKKINPEIKIDITPSFDDSGFNDKILSGTSTRDIYFARKLVFRYIYKPVEIKNKMYDCMFVDLTDIYNNPYNGETQAIKDKLDEVYLDYNAIEKNNETKYYTLPYIDGMLGIVYNEEVWKNEWQLPRTTDELLELCETIKSTKISANSDEYMSPFVYSAAASYYGIYAPLFAAQYEGLETMDNFWDGKDYNGNVSTDIALYDGEYEMLKFMEKLLKYENGYNHSDSVDITFTQAQNYFLSSEKGVAMMVNGDWIESEMRDESDEINDSIKFMKNPVISALGKKLKIAGDGATNAKHEEKLRQTIDLVDQNKTAQEIASELSISEDDASAVIEARNLVITNSNCMLAYVPVYSNMAEEAKDFLQFMYSDKGIEIFTKSTQGYTLPVKYNFLAEESPVKDTFSPLNLSKMDILQNSTIYFQKYKSPIFALGGLTEFDYKLGVSFETYLGAEPDDKLYGNKRTADYIFDTHYNNVKENWNEIKRLAGLS